MEISCIFLDYGLKQNTVFHVSLLKCKVHYKKSHASLMVGYHKPWNIIQLWTVLYVVMWSYWPMWSDIDQRFKTWYWPGLRVRYHFCVLGRYLFIWVHKSTYWPYNHSQHMILLITLLSVLKQKILHTEKSETYYEVICFLITHWVNR